MESQSQKEIKTFKEFWPFYLGEHRLPITRRLHFVGTSLSLMVVLAAVATRNAWLVPAALVAGYGFAWFAHFKKEKNRPATFKYPLWSFLADFKMWYLTLTRKKF